MGHTNAHSPVPCPPGLNPPPPLPLPLLLNVPKSFPRRPVREHSKKKGKHATTTRQSSVSPPPGHLPPRAPCVPCINYPAQPTPADRHSAPRRGQGFGEQREAACACVACWATRTRARSRQEDEDDDEDDEALPAPRRSRPTLVPTCTHVVTYTHVVRMCCVDESRWPKLLRRRIRGDCRLLGLHVAPFARPQCRCVRRLCCCAGCSVVVFWQHRHSGLRVCVRRAYADQQAHAGTWGFRAF